jgi:hypothetical protein
MQRLQADRQAVTVDVIANGCFRQAHYLHASLGYLLAWAELVQAVGRTPGILNQRR